MNATVGQRKGNGYISVHLCRAIRALRAEGWTVRKTAFALEVNEETVIRHATAECGCVDRGEDEQ